MYIDTFDFFDNLIVLLLIFEIPSNRKEEFKIDFAYKYAEKKLNYTTVKKIILKIQQLCQIDINY